MGAYITNETADQDPITNPFGTHSHIGKYFTNIPKQYFSKQKWKSGGELDGKLYHPRKSESRSNHQSIWNSYQAQYFTNIPKNHFTRGGQAKVQIRSGAESEDPANQHDRSTNPSGTNDPQMRFWLDLFSWSWQQRYYVEISGISYKTLWAIFFAKPVWSYQPINSFQSQVWCEGILKSSPPCMAAKLQWCIHPRSSCSQVDGNLWEKRAAKYAALCVNYWLSITDKSILCIIHLILM